jgi:sulfopyruvate decarboxylase subunit alpha
MVESSIKNFAESVSGQSMADELRELEITHVVTVPDTHQRTLLDLLYESRDIEVVTASTEDEAFAVHAGLYMGGARPMLIIQHVGVFAGLNSIRGISTDMKVPTFALVGLFARDATKELRDNRNSAVRQITPLLDAMNIPYFELNSANDLRVIREGYDLSLENLGPVFILVGERTN